MLAKASLIMWSRPGCELCEHMLQALGAAFPGEAARLEIRDVDADPVAHARWGLKIPVLLLDGELVCYGHLDGDELRRALAASDK
jgi:predicted thioredoxin/glutaredoxin